MDHTWPCEGPLRPPRTGGQPAGAAESPAESLLPGPGAQLGGRAGGWAHSQAPFAVDGDPLGRMRVRVGESDAAADPGASVCRPGSCPQSRGPYRRKPRSSERREGMKPREIKGSERCHQPNAKRAVSFLKKKKKQEKHIVEIKNLYNSRRPSVHNVV